VLTPPTVPRSRGENLKIRRRRVGRKHGDTNAVQVTAYMDAESWQLAFSTSSWMCTRKSKTKNRPKTPLSPIDCVLETASLDVVLRSLIRHFRGIRSRLSTVRRWKTSEVIKSKIYCSYAQPRRTKPEQPGKPSSWCVSGSQREYEPRRCVTLPKDVRRSLRVSREQPCLACARASFRADERTL
jgi:hypothetical protein